MKAEKTLEWKNKLNFIENINFTIDWYRFYLDNKNNKKKILQKSIEQINLFEKK